MIEEIEKLHPQLHAATILWPVKSERFGHGEVEVCLARSVHDTGTAISESGTDAIRSDDRRRRETGLIEVIVQLRLYAARGHNLPLRANAG